MTMTLSDLRQRRDENEREEQLARAEQIRGKLVPLLLMDLRGELTESLGLSLLELCDDLDIGEEDYADLQRTAKAIAQDHIRALELEPKIEGEKLRFAKMVLAKRRAEQMGLAADKADRKQQSLRRTKSDYSRQVEIYQNTHPFFFSVDGEPLPELVALPLPEREPRPEPQMANCAICLTDFQVDGKRQFCSARCEHIATEHAAALVQLKVLKRKPK